ncbi:hypothetical protein EVAR_34844_1 [Eumeta japonica]|uniref:Uncharacterized protein n=1 Tax=Eumeta variegata TaxID=151549 RepID=A0A4C1YYP9_EUMVA|nr:hypothetical protein EVAR_34844_1 [Eumeta japonica]
MDVDHEKLLSGDVNFKWQRDFTAFTAVREEFFVHPVGAVKDYDSPYDAFIDIFDVDIMKEIVIETNRYAQQIGLLTKCLHFSDNDKQPLPNAKSKQPLAPVTNQLLTVQLPADNRKESVGEEKKITTKKSVDDCDERAEAERWHDTSNVEALTVWAQYAPPRKNIPEDVKEMKKNCEKGTIIARHPAIMVLAKDAKSYR